MNLVVAVQKINKFISANTIKNDTFYKLSSVNLN